MKKFDIKKVLILVLALVMVLALVACDPSEGGNEDCTHVDANHDATCDICGERMTAYRHTASDDADGDGKCDVCGKEVGGAQSDKVTTAQYFETLWNSAASIGQESFDKTDDVALDLDLGVYLGTEKGKLIDLGVAASVILDRVQGTYSAAKVQIKESENNWLTVYFFLNDPYNFYVDWSYDDYLQQFKISADLGFNNTWASAVHNFLYTRRPNGKCDVCGNVEGSCNLEDGDHKFVDEKIEDVAGQVIDNVVDKMGNKWTLNGLVEMIFDLIGMNLSDITSNSIVQSLMGDAIKGKTAEEINEMGVLALLKSVGPILTGEDAKKKSYPVKTETKDGVQYYTAPVKTSLLGTVSGLIIKGDLKPMLDGTIKAIKTLELTYGVKDNAIDSFAINAQLKTNSSGSEYVALGVKINDLKIRSLDNITNNKTSQDELGFVESEYNPYFDLDVTIGLKLENDAVVLNGFTETPIDLDGNYQLKLNGFVDLINVENNKTNAQLVLTSGSKEIAKVTYGLIPDSATAGQIILTVDSSDALVQAFGENIAPMIVNALAGVKDTADDALFQGAGLVLANAMFTETFATVDDIKAAYAEAGAGVDANFTFNNNFKGVVLQNIKLVKLFTGLFHGDPSYEADASADEDFIKWLPDVYAIIKLAKSVLSRTDGDYAEFKLNAENVGDLIPSVFAQGPESIEEFCYGNDDDIKGLFTQENDDWMTDFFNGSAWVTTDHTTIASLLGSDVAITVKDSPEIKVEVVNGKAKAEISISIGVKASKNQSPYAQINRPAGIAADHSTDGPLTAGTDVWAVLTIH